MSIRLDDPTGGRPLLTRVRRALHRRRTWFIGVPVLLVGGVLGGGFAYNSYLNSHTPPPLSFGDTLGAGSLGTPAPSGPGAQATAAAKAAKAAKGAAKGTIAATSAPKATTAARVVTDPQNAVAPATKATRKASAAPAAASPIEGTWAVATGSVAGYRIGYSSPIGGGTRVGRTDAVTGDMRIVGSTVQATRISVDFRPLTSDGGSTCDDHVRQIMDVANHPFESLVLTTPIELGSVPADGKQVSSRVTAKVTLRGVTRAETFTLTARRNGSKIEVLGSVPVNRDDYQIPDANEPGFTIDKKGTIEVLLVFTKKS